VRTLFRLLLIIATLAGIEHASAGQPLVFKQRLVFNQCRLYGFLPHTHAYALCRMEVRRYWTTPPCGDAFFAFAHREYCHLNPPPFFD
jgi:hypothetical protein